jgi:hypothetical protein
VRRLTLILAAAAVLALGTASTASAAAPTKPIATPAQICRDLVQFGAGGYDSFQDCMRQINGDVRDYRFPANPEDPTSPLLSLSQNCAALEAGITDPVTGEFLQVTYPFYFAEPPGWPFPQYTGMNHRQCQLAIYAYHRFVGL